MVTRLSEDASNGQFALILLLGVGVGCAIALTLTGFTHMSYMVLCIFATGLLLAYDFLYMRRESWRPLILSMGAAVAAQPVLFFDDVSLKTLLSQSQCGHHAGNASTYDERRFVYGQIKIL